jgi:hypothetical protein
VLKRCPDQPSHRKHHANADQTHQQRTGHPRLRVAAAEPLGSIGHAEQFIWRFSRTSRGELTSSSLFAMRACLRLAGQLFALRSSFLRSSAARLRRSKRLFGASRARRAGADVTSSARDAASVGNRAPAVLRRREQRRSFLCERSRKFAGAKRPPAPAASCVTKWADRKRAVREQQAQKGRLGKREAAAMSTCAVAA